MELSKKITARASVKRLLSGEDDIIKPCMREERFEILVDQELYAAVFATPDNMDEFVAGYLISAGLITGRKDIVSCRLCESNRFYVILSEEFTVKIRAGGGVAQYIRTLPVLNWGDISSVRSMPVYTPEEVADICRMAENNEKLQSVDSLGFYAGRVSKGEIAELYFDISGANALDKLVGRAAQDGVFDGVLLTNARPSIDIIQRCHAAKVPIGIFSGVPSNGGLNFAKKAGIAIVSTDKPREYLIFADSARRIRKV